VGFRPKSGFFRGLENRSMLDSMFSPAMFDSMFHLPLPIMEKLASPVIVSLVLVMLLRLFGKRELAQPNPFDLVVLLSFSNTVQNAIVGDDNSVTGGMIGAFGLLAVNGLVVRVLFSSKRLTRVLEGRSAVLILNGQLDRKVMERESLPPDELLFVIHKQGFEDFDKVRKCQLEPNGTFYVEAFDPSVANKRHYELLARLDALSREVAALCAQTCDSARRENGCGAFLLPCGVSGSIQSARRVAELPKFDQQSTRERPIAWLRPDRRGRREKSAEAIWRTPLPGQPLADRTAQLQRRATSWSVLALWLPGCRAADE
jgi:uncharacterized membrane protein YcaP (DUF421 family)